MKQENQNSEQKTPKGKGCLQAIIGIFVIAFALALFTDDEPAKDSTPVAQEQSATDQKIDGIINQAQPYKVGYSKDLSIGNRSRFNANITTADNLSDEQLLATAAQAAKDLQLKNRVQVASVNVMVNGAPKVTVNYAPDMKGWSGDYTGGRFVIE
ncbi:hypothetical protein [Salinivibrio sp. KP-1]|uniref:DUF4875 domain-containing protein n=1 Tax=Salinivibrio sp. KP-1 TaxID=1406902 RepID=UPI0006146F39|nr:hypothetical protein [Salinivibrio sp. KP-1]KKA45127.1 hypothetical protein WN56_06850 [Salinivibrio sp. KP-1]